MFEEWRDISGYEGRYQVSDQGNVRSLERRITVGRTTRRVAARVLCKSRHTGGYQLVCLGRNNSRLVHILVMRTFVGDPPAGREVLHRDGNPANNHLSNLRYGTVSENCADVIKHGRRRVSLEQVALIRACAAKGFLHGERAKLARTLGIHSRAIYYIAAGERHAFIS